MYYNTCYDDFSAYFRSPSENALKFVSDLSHFEPIGPPFGAKSDIPGVLLAQNWRSTVHFQITFQYMYLNGFWKSFGFVYFGTKLVRIGPKSDMIDIDEHTDKTGPELDTSRTFYDEFFSIFQISESKCTAIRSIIVPGLLKSVEFTPPSIK